MWAAKPASDSTACTSAERRANHGVLAPAPNSKTRAVPPRSMVRKWSTRSIARKVHQGVSSSSMASTS
jgi:hypothetical protein